METCKYCCGVKSILDTQLIPSRKNEFGYPGIEVMIDGEELCVYAVADTYEPNFQEEFVTINFCPMCGRKLKEE